MKKYISIVLFTISLFSVFAPTVFAITSNEIMLNNNGVEITKQQYNNLLSLGFNDVQIKKMEVDEFNVNKDLSAVIIAKKSKYIKVMEYYNVEQFDLAYKNDTLNNLKPIKVEEIELTKEQYEKESVVKSVPKMVTINSNTRNGEIGTAKVNTAYKTLQSAILKLGAGQYRVRSDLVWTQMPVNRGEDLLRTEVGSNVVPIDGERYGKQLWTLTSNNNKIEGEQVYSSSSSKWINDNYYSRTLKPNLKNDEGSYKVTYLWIYMYYNLSKNYNGTVNVLDAFGEYKHWRLDGYDSMAQTHAQATNVNW